MPISTTTRKAGPFPGNGAARDFSFNFKVFAPDELRVSATNAAGAEQVLVFNADYTVALNPDQDADAGGVVTLGKALVSGFRLVILSNVDNLQPIDLTNQGGFYPDVVNEGLDRATAQIQQLGEKIGRSVTVPPSTPEGTDLSLPEPDAGKLLAWGENGLYNLDPSGLVSVAAYGNAIVDKFDGDGSTTVFTLSQAAASTNNLKITVDGVGQTPGEDFTSDGGTVLSFFSPPPAATRIVVQYAQALPELGDIELIAETAGATAGAAAAAIVSSKRALKVEKLADVASVPASEVVIHVEGRSVVGDGYEGTFIWQAGDFSALVASDPMRGVYISFTGGLTGAWVRDCTEIDAGWFGGLTSASINRALSLAKAIGGKKVVTADGSYTMSETVEYFGDGSNGVSFDGADATFLRYSDYGPTFYIHGLVTGDALQNTDWKFGRIISSGPMTVANSRCHILFDHVYFLNWSAPYIRNGCGGVHILGCASWSDMGGIHAWRFEDAYQPGSIGYLVGNSELAGSLGLKGGDAHIGSLTDVYGGTMVGGFSTTSVVTSSITVPVGSTTGINIGDIIEGAGWSKGDNPNRYIPKGVTVASIGSGVITLSASVSLPSGYPLLAFRPCLEDGVVIQSSDGLWVEGFIHSMMSRRYSFLVDTGSTAPVSNVRLKIMPDAAPAVGLRIQGVSALAASNIELHHPYGGSIEVVAPLLDTNIWSPQENWSRSGFSFGGGVSTPLLSTNVMDLSEAGGYAEQRWRGATTTRYTSFFEDASNNLGLNSHTTGGAFRSQVYVANYAQECWEWNWPIRLPRVSVSGLASAPYSGLPSGAIVDCTNARAVVTGGAIQAAGAGTGSIVRRGGDGKWYLAGTAIEAVS